MGGKYGASCGEWVDERVIAAMNVGQLAKAIGEVSSKVLRKAEELYRRCSAKCPVGIGKVRHAWQYSIRRA